MVLGMGQGELGAVHGEAAGTARPQIRQYAVRAMEDPSSGLGRARRDLRLHDYQCATLLEPGEYQVVVVDAPNVPLAELRAAIRWRVKDLLDFHVDDVTIDVLDIPILKDAPARNHTMYAVAARNEVIQARIGQFE